MKKGCGRTYRQYEGNQPHACGRTGTQAVGHRRDTESFAELIKGRHFHPGFAYDFETLADYAPTTRDIDILTEYVRQSLKRAISGKYFPANETTSVVTLDPKMEQEIMNSVKQTEQGAYLTLDPEKTKAVIASVGEEVQKLENLGKNPIIITSPIVRMYFKRLTEDYYKDLIVVSYNEIESNVELQSVGMVTIA